jgi:hypothetical protein
MTRSVDDWGPEGFLLGMLTGVVIGAGVAILLGSKTGAGFEEPCRSRRELAPNGEGQVGKREDREGGGGPMNHHEHGGKEKKLEEHSLPGTNQAGKEASSCEKDQKKRPGRAPQHQDQLEEHSLPGTNQAGKEAASCEKNDEG